MLRTSLSTLKTCQFNESRRLFVVLNLNTIVQGKTPETSISWMMLSKQGALKIFKCWNSVIVCPPYYNFWLRAWLPLLVFTKILWFVFDLNYVIWCLLVAVHFISELTKWELIDTVFEHNYICLSLTLRMNVFIVNSVLSARCLDIRLPPLWV